MNNYLKILNYLGKHIKERFTMHGLSKTLEIPYASFYRSVKQLHDLLIMEHIGRAKVIGLNTSNPVLKAYLTIAADEEKKKFIKNNLIVGKITRELNTTDTVVLFGSFAKREETKKSDIDLLIINRNGKKTLSFSRFELLFKRKINPIFITKKEFAMMLKDREENVGKQALKNHIMLNNAEEFWECVLHAV